MKFTKKQYTETGKFFLDLAKVAVAVFVFTSFQGYVLKFIFGLMGATFFYTAGILFIQKGE